jgi:hypothetical protein
MVTKNLTDLKGFAKIMGRIQSGTTSGPTAASESVPSEAL